MDGSEVGRWVLLFAGVANLALAVVVWRSATRRAFRSPRWLVVAPFLAVGAFGLWAAVTW